MTEEGRALAIVLGLLMGMLALAVALGFYTWRARRLARLAAAAEEQVKDSGPRGAAQTRRHPLGKRR
ncbi:MAG: hypothetical protein Q4B13_06205 [Lautropia sp.]|nr:hypothetical protein [Lautropia sp.]